MYPLAYLLWKQEPGSGASGRKRVAVVTAAIGSWPEGCIIGTAVQGVGGYAADHGRLGVKVLRCWVAPKDAVGQDEGRGHIVGRDAVEGEY